jgi:hypothetical protein
MLWRAKGSATPAVLRLGLTPSVRAHGTEVAAPVDRGAPCESSAAPCLPTHAQPRRADALVPLPRPDRATDPQAAGAPSGPLAHAATPGRATHPQPFGPERDHPSPATLPTCGASVAASPFSITGMDGHLASRLLAYWPARFALGGKDRLCSTCVVRADQRVPRHLPQGRAARSEEIVQMFGNDGRALGQTPDCDRRRLRRR